MAEKKEHGHANGGKSSLLTFLWNSEEKSFLGRTGGSWGKIGLFYICFFGGLGLFFWANMAIFFLTMDEYVPKYFGLESQTLNNPGLGYRPMVNVDSSLIRFYQGEVASYGTFTNQLDAYLTEYKTQNASKSSNVVDCSNYTGPGQVPEGKVCSFVNDVPGCSRANHYGYADGKPCIALKMNRIYGFVPDTYKNLSELISDQALGTTKPRFLSFAGGNVGIGCDGENEVDRENLKSLEFFPSYGLASAYYPYTNQPNYVSPFIFLKVNDAVKQVAIMVECKLFARNIANPGGNEMHGTTSFVLAID